MFKPVEAWRKIWEMFSESKIANKMDKVNDWSLSGKKLWVIKSRGWQAWKTY